MTLSEAEATRSILAFLTTSGLAVLSRAHYGTLIPAQDNETARHELAVGKYLTSIEDDADKLARFMVIVHGHTIASAMLASPGRTPPKLFHDTALYLDSPLLISLTGLDGPARLRAAQELVKAAAETSAAVAAFPHCVQEAMQVIESTARHLYEPETTNSIAWEARKRNQTPTDLLLASKKLPDTLTMLGITIAPHPPIARTASRSRLSQDDIAAILSSKINYRGVDAAKCDAKSICAIYGLRDGSPAFHVETCRAVLITDNRLLADEARSLEQTGGYDDAVPPVVTDRFIVNTIWIKHPTSMSSLATNDTIAYAHAAMRPPPTFWKQVTSQAIRLRHQGRISDNDLVAVRALTSITDDVFTSTAGDHRRITAAGIVAAINRNADLERELLNVKETNESLKELIRNARGLELAQAPRNGATTAPSPAITRCIIIIHGMNDTGDWQNLAREVICDNVPTSHCEVVGFKFMGPFDFLWGYTVATKAYDALDAAVAGLLESYPSADMFLIAHSYGCHLAGKLLQQNRAACFRRVIFCGSVLPRDYPWRDVAERFSDPKPHVISALNVIGNRDRYPVLAWWTNGVYGPSGTYGFENPHKVQQYVVNGGHSVFLTRDHMLRTWVPFITEGTCGASTGNHPTPCLLHRFAIMIGLRRVISCVVGNGGWVFFVLVIGALIAVAVIVYGFSRQIR
jgi:pimeloyl-ACP methyl ester carboxylesterase